MVCGTRMATVVRDRKGVLLVESSLIGETKSTLLSNNGIRPSKNVTEKHGTNALTVV